MKTPIYDRLKEIKEKDLVSFHMPGHKNGRLFQELGYKGKIGEFYSLDTTEIIGTDNLHEASGIILESENEAKRVILKGLLCCGTKDDIKEDTKSLKGVQSYEDLDLFYLVNGSTSGIEAAISASLRSGDKIIINRTCHHSAYNTCMLNDIEPVFVDEIIDEDFGVFKGASREGYMDAIKQNSDAKAIFITRPSYYGMVFDIGEIIELAHEKNMVVIVDEAHGAHFGLSDKLPNSALCYGADIVIQSIHKSLPAFTQTSILLCQSDLVDRSRLKRTLAIFQSSSPSYIMMMSLEMAFDIYDRHGKELMDSLLNNIYVFKRNVKKYKIYPTDDPTKIFINTIDNGINGYDFAKILRYEYNIQVEMSNYNGILMLCTIGNTKKDFDTMLNALKDFSNRKLFGANVDFFKDSAVVIGESRSTDIRSLYHSKKVDLKFPRVSPKSKIRPRQAFDMESESIDIDDSLGRICGEFVIPYPPGVCLIGPGEEISQEVVDYIEKARNIKIDINGIESRDFKNIKVLKIGGKAEIGVR